MLPYLTPQNVQILAYGFAKTKRFVPERGLPGTLSCGWVNLGVNPAQPLSVSRRLRSGSPSVSSIARSAFPCAPVPVPDRPGYVLAKILALAS